MAEISAHVAEAMAEGEYYLALRIDEEIFAGDDFDDETHFVHDLGGKVFLAGYSGEVLAEIGTFAVVMVDVDGVISQCLSIFDAYDSQQETLEYFEDLVDLDHEWNFKRKVLEALGCAGECMPSGMLVISDLDIFSAYRGYKFGLTALKCIIQRFRPGMGIVVMRPFPWQYAHAMTAAKRVELGLDVYKGSKRACLLKLRAHFGRLGFTLIPGTDIMAMGLISPLLNERFDVEQSVNPKSAA